MKRRAFLKVASAMGFGSLLPRIKDRQPIVWPHGVRYKYRTRHHHRVALTLDDGWHYSAMRQMLSGIVDLGRTATLFLHGRGLKLLRENPKLLDLVKEYFTVGYHTWSHPTIEDQKANYHHNRWIDDYIHWARFALETFDLRALRPPMVPYARAAYGFFSPDFMSFCPDAGLTPVAWAADPWTMKRGYPLRAGDVLLLHLRNSDLDWLYHPRTKDRVGLLHLQFTGDRYWLWDFSGLQTLERDERRWDWFIERHL